MITGKLHSELEISVQLTGGHDAYPRYWGPARIGAWLDTGARLTAEVMAETTARLSLRVSLDDFTPLEGGWFAATISVEDVNGWLLGRRPGMFYNRRYDVPTFTNFYVPAESLNCAVGIRRTA